MHLKPSAGSTPGGCALTRSPARPRPPCRRAAPQLAPTPAATPTWRRRGATPQRPPFCSGAAPPPPPLPGQLLPPQLLGRARESRLSRTHFPCAGGASLARAQAPPPAEEVPPPRRPGARRRLAAAAARRAGPMAAEGDAILRARGRTLTAFRQGRHRGVRGSAWRNLGIGLRVPAGSLARRAAGREGRAEGRPAALPGGSGRSAPRREGETRGRRSEGRGQGPGPTGGARKAAIGSPCPGEQAAFGLSLPGGGSSAEGGAVAGRCAERAWSLPSPCPPQPESRGAWKRLPARVAPAPVGKVPAGSNTRVVLKRLSVLLNPACETVSASTMLLCVCTCGGDLTDYRWLIV